MRKSAEAELRESEARLRESEERFRTAFRLSPLNITILRLSDAKFVEANDAFVRWLGLDRDRIVGHDSRELDTESVGEYLTSGTWLFWQRPRVWERCL